MASLFIRKAKGEGGAFAARAKVLKFIAGDSDRFKKFARQSIFEEAGGGGRVGEMKKKLKKSKGASSQGV